MDLPRPASAISLLAALALLTHAGLAQVRPKPPATPTASGVTTTANSTNMGEPTPRRFVRPEQETLARMMRRVSVTLNDTPLSDALGFIQTATGADLEILWLDDNDAAGLSKETLISAKGENLTALRMLEIILERADAKDAAGGAGSTWQMSDTGAMQVGPRERLNKFKRTEVYDIADLVLEVPNYDNAPELDLQQALQASQRGGGGGGQNPFQDEGDDDVPTRPLAERAQEVIDLITTIVETDQWQENGGDGGSIRLFQKALIVKAPDYMHRAINGYPYWPSSATTVGTVKGRRYVSLTVDTAVSDVGEVTNYPVSAVTAGSGSSSGGGSGGGGPTTPPGGGSLPKATPTNPNPPASNPPK